MFMIKVTYGISKKNNAIGTEMTSCSVLQSRMKYARMANTM